VRIRLTKGFGLFRSGVPFETGLNSDERMKEKGLYGTLVNLLGGSGL
jgi:hypothetical protein